MNDFSKLKKELTNLYKQHNITEKSELTGLFCHILKCDLGSLLTIKEVSNSQKNKIMRFAKKRIKGVPFYKLTKKAPFYKDEFLVNNNVLTPRKETEILVETIINQNKNKTLIKILDLGTGSGAIAITLKKHLNCDLVASDISLKALRIAKKNAKLHKTKIRFVKSNLFDKLKKEKFDIIVSNPPYIKSQEIEFLQTEVKNYDPHLALDGGFTGYSFYKRIIRVVTKHLNEGGKLYFELGQNQAEWVEKMLNKNFTNIEIYEDYSKIKRVIVGTKKENI